MSPLVSVVLVLVLVGALALLKRKSAGRADALAEANIQHLLHLTSHSGTPTDLFSKGFHNEKSWWHMSEAGINRMASIQGNSISLRDQESIDWLCAAGDQLGHTILASITHLKESGQYPQDMSQEQQDRLFALLLEDSMAHTYDMLKKEERSGAEIEALMSCFSQSLLDRPLEKTRFKELIKRRVPSERMEVVASMGISILSAGPEEIQTVRDNVNVVRHKTQQLMSQLPAE